jgi:CBS domain-containing protein
MIKPIVADVMTREPVTVVAGTTFKDIVDLLVGHEISAVPVVDPRGRLLGVVSEADLLHKEEHVDDAADARPPMLSWPHTRADWRKAVGLTAGELMTTPALTIDAEAYLPAAARELARADVRRLFVVRAERLVGVLARRDLLRGFLRSDKEIEADIEQEVFRRTLSADPEMVRATVEHGVVTLTGRVEYQSDVDIAEHLVRVMPGVIAVRNRLTYQWNGQRNRQPSEQT